jgi:hypothetical protein
VANNNNNKKQNLLFKTEKETETTSKINLVSK